MRKIYIVIVIIGIVFAIFLNVFIQLGNEKKDYALNSQYSVIDKDSSFWGVVRHISEYENRRPKQTLYIDCIDGHKIVAPSNAYPTTGSLGKVQRRDFLGFILEIGDTICKPANKDSLIVIKYGKNYVYYYPSEQMGANFE